jgi:hypothetical protein
MVGVKSCNNRQKMRRTPSTSPWALTYAAGVSDEMVKLCGPCGPPVNFVRKEGRNHWSSSLSLSVPSLRTTPCPPTRM